jgi:hypothetical protein
VEKEVLKDAFREFDKLVTGLEHSMAYSHFGRVEAKWAEIKVAIVQGLETKPEPVMAWPAVQP